jgi:hypothetical protein
MRCPHCGGSAEAAERLREYNGKQKEHIDKLQKRLDTYHNALSLYARGMSDSGKKAKEVLGI